MLAWLAQNIPELGEQLDHSVYEALRNGLLSRAVSLGFFDAEYTRQRLVVSVAQASASIDLSLQLGAGYRVGDVAVDSDVIDRDIVLGMAPFRSGDRYTAAAVAEYTQRLRESGFFASARVTPDFERITETFVPLTISLAPAPTQPSAFGCRLCHGHGPSRAGGVGPVRHQPPWAQRHL